MFYSYTHRYVQPQPHTQTHITLLIFVHFIEIVMKIIKLYNKTMIKTGNKRT